MSFIAAAGEVFDVIVTSERGATRRGLRPGDAIERVEDLYPELDCGETNVASDFEAFVPACWGELKSETYIWIGGDPIDNIRFSVDQLRPRP